MHPLIILLLINYVRTQQDLCSCSCCFGQSCNPVYIGALSMQFCTAETCRTNCRNSYPQCQANDQNGQVVPYCFSYTPTNSPLYNCQCDCCKTGVLPCTPFFVGYSTAHICDPSACSISCFRQYPNQCASDSTGQTSGTCVGLITTTTTITTTTSATVSTSAGSLLGNTCSCMCCQSGPNCSPNIQVGIATVSQCSPTSCTAACQNQYSAACPSLPYLGLTNGICLNQNSGKTRCQCQCCVTNGCPSYDIYTNEDCTSCHTLCQQQSPCGTTIPATFVCNSSIPTKSTQFPLPLIILISLFILFFEKLRFIC
jgi:hypothetical protein